MKTIIYILTIILMVIGAIMGFALGQSFNSNMLSAIFAGGFAFCGFALGAIKRAY